MKLHEALRVILKKSGSSVLDDRRFLSFLADYRVYEDYPAMKQRVLLPDKKQKRS